MTVELILFYNFTVKGYKHFRFDLFYNRNTHFGLQITNYLALIFGRVLIKKSGLTIR